MFQWTSKLKLAREQRLTIVATRFEAPRGPVPLVTCDDNFWAQRVAAVSDLYSGSVYEKEVLAICNILGVRDVQLRVKSSLDGFVRSLCELRPLLNEFPVDMGASILDSIEWNAGNFQRCQDRCGLILQDPRLADPLRDRCVAANCMILNAFRIEYLPNMLRAIVLSGFAQAEVTPVFVHYVMALRNEYELGKICEVGKVLQGMCFEDQRDLTCLRPGNPGDARLLSVLKSNSCTSLEEAIDVATVSLPANYVPIRRLGKGAVATVYLARNTVFDDEPDEATRALNVVALKVVSKGELGKNPGAVQKSLLKLRHLDIPYVAKYYEFTEHGDNLVLSMEPFETTLAGAIADFSVRTKEGEGPLYEAGNVMDLFEQMLIGLAKCHERGILHLDLAPNNVGLTTIGGRQEVRLTDFNESLYWNGTRRQGPLDYLSRRQLLNPEDKSVTAHDTCWSLGVILYEMLTGKKLFSAPPMPDRFDKRAEYKRVMLDRIASACNSPSFIDDIGMEIFPQTFDWSESVGFYVKAWNGLHGRGLGVDFCPDWMKSSVGAESVLKRTLPLALARVIKCALFGVKNESADGLRQRLVESRSAGVSQKPNYLSATEDSLSKYLQAHSAVNVLDMLCHQWHVRSAEVVLRELPIHCLLAIYNEELHRIYSGK